MVSADWFLKLIVAVVLLSSTLRQVASEVAEEPENQEGKELEMKAGKMAEENPLKGLFPQDLATGMQFKFDFGDLTRMINDSDLGMQNVMQMMFTFNDNMSHAYMPDYPISPHMSKFSDEEYWQGELGDTIPGKKLSELVKIRDVLRNGGNASFDIVNGNIVLDEDSEEVSSDGNPDRRETDEDGTETAHQVPQNTTAKPRAAVNASTIAPYDWQLLQLQELVQQGYLNQKVVDDFKSGEITAKEIEKRLMTDKDFVLAQFPPKFADMLEKKDSRIPDEIYVIIFSGKVPLSHLKWKVYENNRVVKALMPDRIKDVLETRDPPFELKVMLYNGDNSTEILQQAMGNETLLRKMMSASMFYFYTIFKVPRNVAINMALSGTAIVVLVSVMTSLGCTMTVTEIMKHVKRPKGVIIALLSQYGIMPVAAFGLTQLFKLDVYPAIAVLICGCCPGGNLSNMLAFAINGDMNLSILMTTCSSVLGLGMMPLLIFCYSRFIIPLDSAEIVPFDKIILNVALTIIPVSAGIAIKHYRPHWTKNVMRFGAIMLVLCSITFGVLAGLLMGDKFFQFFSPSVVACAAILPLTGYIFGFAFARVAKEDQKCCRTICVETGCQNVQLCGTVLKLAFDPILVGAMILLPLIYMCFQTGEAILLVTIYRIYERCTGKKKATDSINSDEEKKLERSDSEIKVAEEDEKPLKKESDEKDEKKKEEKPLNGVKESKEEEALERWPLAGTPSPEFIDSFKNGGQENYV